MLERFFKALNRGGLYLWGEGSWQLLPHESTILQAVIESLPGEAKSFGQAQLNEKFFIERVNPRINRISHDELPDRVRIPDPDFTNALYKARITVDGKRETANVIFYMGMIFSVEMRRPRKLYRGTEVLVTAVEKGNPKQSLTFVVDRAEHGSMEE